MWAPCSRTTNTVWYRFSFDLRAIIFFSWPARKESKEAGQRGATKMRPLWNPPPLLHPTLENVPIFGCLPGKNPASLWTVSVQKSEHFWTLAGEAAQGFLKGTCLFGMSPWVAFFWYFSWRPRKVHALRPPKTYQTATIQFWERALYKKVFIVDMCNFHYYVNILWILKKYVYRRNARRNSRSGKWRL